MQFDIFVEFLKTDRVFFIKINIRIMLIIPIKQIILINNFNFL